MGYRLYRREPIKAGSWYYVTPCKGCSKHVYLLDDRSKGIRPVQMTGDGLFSSPCLRCAHENVFGVPDISVVQADEDLPGARPERIQISKSGRKPLLRSYPNAGVTMGVGYVEDRPKAAAIIGRIITAWADIEVQCARLLAELMGTNIPAAGAVFGSLRSSRAQHDALEAAAKVVLNNQDYELFSAHMARRASLEKERNDIAHGCYGVAVSIPEHVIWVAQSDYLAFTNTAKSNSEVDPDFRSKIFVYEVGTLERISQEIEEFYLQLGFFSGYLHSRDLGPNGAAFRAERYPQLCSQPHIRQALDRIRTAKKAEQGPRRERTVAQKLKR